MRLPDLEAWGIFASVVEHRSFSASAQALGLSKATVSKAITRLEAQLGQSLFHRTSRRIALTEAGKPLAEHAARIVSEARAAEETAFDGASAPAGRIRLASPLNFGINTVAPLLAEFLVRHPGIDIDFHLSDARIDIVAEGFDVALRIAPLLESSLQARPLCDILTRTVAAPSYLAKYGTPLHPSELAGHRLLIYSNIVGPWHFSHANDTDVPVRPTGRLTANSGVALIPALIAGLGITVLPDFEIDRHIESGAVVAILPEWRVPLMSLHLITPPSTLRPARVETLITFLAKRLKAAAAE